MCESECSLLGSITARKIPRAVGPYLINVNMSAVVAKLWLLALSIYSVACAEESCESCATNLIQKKALARFSETRSVSNKSHIGGSFSKSIPCKVLTGAARHTGFCACTQDQKSPKP